MQASGSWRRTLIDLKPVGERQSCGTNAVSPEVMGQATTPSIVGSPRAMVLMQTS